jgi:hypothetical protein
MNPVFVLRRLFHHLGWPGVLGVILTVLAVVMALSVMHTKALRLAELKRESASLKVRIEQVAKSGIPETGSQDDLAQFYDFFADTYLTEALNKLFAAAAKEKLVLEQGEYRVTPDKSGKLSRYQIVLPVKGSYLQIRQFVARALNDVPVAALEDINFKRETIGATQLEARIKFTLFLATDSMGTN